MSRTGVELLGPEVFVLSIVGAVLIIAGFQRSGRQFRSRVSVLAPSTIALVMSGWYFTQVNARVDEVASDMAVASIGTGLWLAIAAAVVAFAVGLFASTAVRVETPELAATPAW